MDAVAEEKQGERDKKRLHNTLTRFKSVLYYLNKIVWMISNNFPTSQFYSIYK